MSAESETSDVLTPQRPMYGDLIMTLDLWERLHEGLTDARAHILLTVETERAREVCAILGEHQDRVEGVVARMRAQ